MTWLRLFKIPRKLWRNESFNLHHEAFHKLLRDKILKSQWYYGELFDTKQQFSNLFQGDAASWLWNSSDLMTDKLGAERISRFNLAKKQTSSAQSDSYKTCWFNGSDYALSTYILLLSLRQSCIDERFQKTQNHSENLLTVIVYIETGRNKYSNNGSLPRLNIRCVYCLWS